jgi:hypothetical protein
MINEEIGTTLNRKITGATSEILRRKELDETVEKNLSAGLENSLEFVAASTQIDEKRAIIVSTYNKYINQQPNANSLVSINNIFEEEIVLADEAGIEETIIDTSIISATAEPEKKSDSFVKRLAKKIFSIFK